MCVNATKAYLSPHTDLPTRNSNAPVVMNDCGKCVGVPGREREVQHEVSSGSS